MDIKKLTRAEQIISGSGIALLIFSFFPWFSVDLGFVSASANAWDYFFFGTLPVLLGLVMVAQVILSRLTEVKLPAIPIPWGQVHMIVGIAVAALVLLKLIIGEDFADRSIGIFLSLLAALGLAAGGFLRSKEPEDAPAPPSAPEA